MDDNLECPRCGSNDITEDPDTDLPGDNSDYACNECLYLWDD